ncbi:hypothetical protein CLIM01_02401 [Colletotrichum limetticola]|uniref:Uncharacterized protein n=1 Tax=Colletotrichum limetticola TaxID=1209924 RepID=A0ABQ9Q996_9PEZI|nr:hypothetical protein CLIM01_02401 [Colletotrichum limetticola]
MDTTRSTLTIFPLSYLHLACQQTSVVTSIPNKHHPGLRSYSCEKSKMSRQVARQIDSKQGTIVASPNIQYSQSLQILPTFCNPCCVYVFSGARDLFNPEAVEKIRLEIRMRHMPIYPLAEQYKRSLTNSKASVRKVRRSPNMVPVNMAEYDFVNSCHIKTSIDQALSDVR